MLMVKTINRDIKMKLLGLETLPLNFLYMDKLFGLINFLNKKQNNILDKCLNI